MENISYGELALCQQLAKEAAEYYEKEIGNYPAFRDEAETAVDCAYTEKLFSIEISLQRFNEIRDIIIDEIGWSLE